MVIDGEATVQLINKRKARRRMFRQLPLFSVRGYGPICLDTNDPHTVECSFKKRLMRDVPPYNKALLVELSDFVRNWLTENVRPVVPLPFEEWLSTTTYNEERKQELREAFNRLRGDVPAAEACSAVQAFVKSEAYDEWKHARMINSRSDEFKAFSGPLFKAIEKELYTNKAFIKHVPVPDRPALIAALNRTGRVVIDSDFKAYESHFVKAIMLAVECQLYTHCLKGSCSKRVLTCLIRAITGTNNIRLRCGIKARLQARRMSGDMCTSLGNGFTNLMLALFIAHKYNYTIEGFVEGDDGIFALSGCTDGWVPTPRDGGKPTPGGDCPLVREYAKLGFTIEINSYADARLASFCGMVFGPDNAIIRDPRHFLRTFGWTQSFINARTDTMMELLRAKALSSSYETPQCPIVGALARAALRHTEGYAARFVEDGYHWCPRDELHVEEFAPSLATRMLFETRYGVSVETQIMAEAAIEAGDMDLLSECVPPTDTDLWYTDRYLVTD